MSNLSIKLLESDGMIVKKINTSLAKMLNKSLVRSANTISTNLKPIVAGSLSTSPEISSLSGGTLRVDFGLTTDPSGAIINSIINTLDVKVDKVVGSNTGIKGGLLITMQPIDYTNLFSLSVAEQIIEGGSIPWLRWLLTFGQQIIIGNFGVKYESGKGRTGGGHMTVEQRPFKIHSGFAGTVDDNFITRAVSQVSPQIKNTIIKAI